MIVYHGSYLEIDKPDVSYSRKAVDFGKGFYVTPIKEQAVKWSARFKRRKGKSIVSSYELDEAALSSTYKAFEFKSYSEEWLDFISVCRTGKDYMEYDIIIGGVADDKVYDTIELYFDGLLEKSEAINRLRYEDPNLQICIRTQEVIDKYVRFLGSEEIL